MFLSVVDVSDGVYTELKCTGISEDGKMLVITCIGDKSTLLQFTHLKDDLFEIEFVGQNKKISGIPITTYSKLIIEELSFNISYILEYIERY